MRIAATGWLLLLGLVLSAGCGSAPTQPALPGPQAAPSGGLDAVPRDGVQPWERVGPDGLIVPGDAARWASAFPQDSLFTPGVERFDDGGSAVDNGEACALTAPAAGLSYALYRFTLGGGEPSALAVDANLLPVGAKRAEYWVGVANYGRGRWEWHGPMPEAQVTLTLNKTDSYTSPLGNTFVAVAVHDGAQLDVVGVTVTERDSLDTTAPPAPGAPSASVVDGGLELSWTGVIAADLAGYRIYWSEQSFSATSDSGVSALPWVEGTTRTVLPLRLDRDNYYALSAVDVQGNESALSPVTHQGPEPNGNPLLVLHVSADQVSAQRGDLVQVTASGAELYDFDTDGDGVFDITDSVVGTVSVDTQAPGIIRPRVRGRSGTAVAFGSVSLLITGNQRPVASGQVEDAAGVVPFDCFFSGLGADSDGTIVEYAWDFEGDGIYDYAAPGSAATATTYLAAGLYNAKFRVTDDRGDWDVDTLAVLAEDPPLNLPPVAVLSCDRLDLVVGQEHAEEVNFDGTASYDPEGGTLTYLYQWNDGSPDEDSFEGFADHNYALPGTYTVKLKVTDPEGASNTETIQVTVRRLQPTILQASGDVGRGCRMAAGNNLSIAYRDVDSGALMFLGSTDATGRSWREPLTLDASGADYLSVYQELDEVGVAYYQGGQLFLQRSTNSGLSFEGKRTVDDGAGDDVGNYCSLSNNPGWMVAYHNETAGTLLVRRSSDAQGLNWGPVAVVDSTPGADVGEHACLVEWGSTDNVAYYDATNKDLKFATYSGSSWQSTTLDSTDDVGKHASLTFLSNGNRAIAYYMDGPSSQDSLKYIRGSGSSWQAPQFLNNTGGSGPLALQVVSGKPVIAFASQNSRLPAYLAAADGLGDTWWPAVAGDMMGSGNAWLDAAVMSNGQLGICYFEDSQDDLRFSTARTE
jgi:PKD repeat protein